MAAGQPIKLSNMPVATTGTVFPNKGTVITDVPTHSVTFQFRPWNTKEVTSVKEILKYTTGTFAVSGQIQWSAPAQKPNEDSEKQVRDGTITDSTGSIKLSVWEEHIEETQEGEFYTVTGCKLRFYYGKCLSTSREITVTGAAKQALPDTPKKESTILCYPEILNVAINMYPVYNNKDCKTKINGNPGTKLVKYLSCNRYMQIKNWT